MDRSGTWQGKGEAAVAVRGRWHSASPANPPFVVPSLAVFVPLPVKHADVDCESGASAGVETSTAGTTGLKFGYRYDDLRSERRVISCPSCCSQSLALEASLSDAFGLLPDVPLDSPAGSCPAGERPFSAVTTRLRELISLETSCHDESSFPTDRETCA